jgi:hypothetical protein
VVFFDAALERKLKVNELVPQPALGELCYLLGRGFPLDEGVEHQPSRNPKDIARNRRELDVGGLQHLEEPIAFGRTALSELASVPQQVPQLA